MSSNLFAGGLKNALKPAECITRVFSKPSDRRRYGPSKTCLECPKSISKRCEAHPRNPFFTARKMERMKSTGYSRNKAPEKTSIVSKNLSTNPKPKATLLQQTSSFTVNTVKDSPDTVSSWFSPRLGPGEHYPSSLFEVKLVPAKQDLLPGMQDSELLATTSNGGMGTHKSAAFSLMNTRMMSQSPSSSACLTDINSASPSRVISPTLIGPPSLSRRTYPIFTQTLDSLTEELSEDESLSNSISR